jgi:putative heme-binding domain-containing protein
VFGGPGYGDRIIARRAMTPELWTHVAVTRDEKGAFRIYLDGELDNADSKPLKEALVNLDIGRVAPAKGTGAMLSEYRVWNRWRTADEIRSNFDQSFEGEPLPSGLVKYFPGGGPWGKLNGTARVARTLDPPPLLTAAEARVQHEKFAKYRALAEKPGDAARGKSLAAACTVCHAIQGQGGAIGPNLSGAGAMSLEALLRSLLTPNAAMEAGYRVFRVELNSDDLLDGFLVSQDNQSIILRIPNSEDRRIAKADIRRASFIRRSLMPEGLLEALSPQDVTDLFAYLKTLK